MNADFLSPLKSVLDRHGLGSLLELTPVSGGDINDTFRLRTSENLFFLKRNLADRYPQMFEAERHGLDLLARTRFTVPRPIAVERAGPFQVLIMEWMEKGAPQPEFWRTFGRWLALMHKRTNARFGLDRDNYIGPLPQSNKQKESWADFYLYERLAPQLQRAISNGRASATMQNGFEKLFQRMGQLFPPEPPALIHGDLWSGNLMVASDGSPCLYDPAVYYGHREMDLAMMALFGGFDNHWTEGYNEVYPLENGWRERIELGQLYPLMVHVNLFGGGYARSVERILLRYV